MRSDETTAASSGLALPTDLRQVQLHAPARRLADTLGPAPPRRRQPETTRPTSAAVLPTATVNARQHCPAFEELFERLDKADPDDAFFGPTTIAPAVTWLLHDVHGPRCEQALVCRDVTRLYGLALARVEFPYRDSWTHDQDAFAELTNVLAELCSSPDRMRLNTCLLTETIVLEGNWCTHESRESSECAARPLWTRARAAWAALEGRELGLDTCELHPPQSLPPGGDPASCPELLAPWQAEAQ